MNTFLHLACIDTDAPPLFGRIDADGRRLGFEPAVAELVAEELGLEVKWEVMAWEQMLPAVRDHQVDAVLCGQGIIPSRQEVVDFTHPYAVFHESVLVRQGDETTGPEGLRGRRVAAIADSTNMALANTFEGAVTVPFGGTTDDVYTEMLDALRSGDVDAVVDDDVVFVPLGSDHPEFRLAFTVQTGNRWGIGVAKDAPEVQARIDQALRTVIADGRHRAVWAEHLPTLPYPFEDSVS